MPRGSLDDASRLTERLPYRKAGVAGTASSESSVIIVGGLEPCSNESEDIWRVVLGAKEEEEVTPKAETFGADTAVVRAKIRVENFML